VLAANAATTNISIAPAAAELGNVALPPVSGVVVVTAARAPAAVGIAPIVPPLYFAPIALPIAASRTGAAAAPLVIVARPAAALGTAIS
jgi:hypothetical protein